MPLQRRLPKVGFRSKSAALSAEVLLYRLVKISGDVIDLAVLKAAGLVGPDVQKVKIVKQGEVARALKVSGVLCTAGAKAAIEAAGGSVE